MTKQANLLQLKITLQGSRPPIWREIIVPADYTFFDLHVTIQDAFGWEDCHLHQYFTASPRQKNGQYKNIAWPSPEMDDVIDERQAKLDEHFKETKNTLFYEYDFGDSWMHEIKLKKILPRDPKIKYPQIIGGERACPPEDCGGLWGYYDLIEMIKNPKHQEHQDMMEWLGIDDPKEFDPEKFSINEVKFRNPKEVLQEYEDNINF